MDQLMTVPLPTLVFPGHDYAGGFLRDAVKRDPGNAKMRAQLDWAEACQADGNRPAVPSTMQRARTIFIHYRNQSAIFSICFIC
jgi:hypothetical protein